MFESQDSSQAPKYVQIHDPQNEGISAIFTDGTTNPDGSIRNLGATFADKLTYESYPIPEVPQPKCLHIPTSTLPGSWTTAFISTATFSNLQDIAICKRGNRITGLRIRHSDDTVGQGIFSSVQTLTCDSQPRF